MKNIQDIRDSRASQFVQMAIPLSVIVFEGQIIRDKGMFVETSLQAIYAGHVDHISDAENRFDALVRLYLEHTSQMVIK